MEVNLAGLKLEHPIMNAAGTCKGLDGQEGLRQLVRSATAACMMGSVTSDQRGGNEGSVYYAEDVFSLNSLGLPNPGSVYYCAHLPEMVQIAHDSDKLLFVSAAGFSPEDYVLLAQIALDRCADLVELNFGCPNVWQRSQQKPIASFVPILIEETLRKVEEKVGVAARIAVKLSPYSNPITLAEVATVLGQSPLVKVVTTTNTFPNALAYDAKGNQRISVGAGLAGLGGPAMKPIGLGQVRQLRDLLPARIQIIGVGGIRTGQDVLDYLLAGATAVGIATAKIEEGDAVFSRLLTELVDLQERGSVDPAGAWASMPIEIAREIGGKSIKE